MTAQNIGYGQKTLYDGNDSANRIAFIVRQMMAQMATTKLVRVEAVHAGAGDPPLGGTVDVLPLVNQVDGNNNPVKHGIVHGVPYFRMQGGVWAVICDPAVGDVGYVTVCDRDISLVKSTSGEQSNPGSYRKFDLADGIYVGGLLNAPPTAYVHLKPDGSLTIVDAHGNMLETSAAGFAITTAPGGDFVVNGISVTLHLHGGVTVGAGTTGVPV